MTVLSKFAPPENAVLVFDFDGVVCARHEDDLYRMPMTDAHVKLIEQARKGYGLRCAGMDMKYQRHLVFQIAAMQMRMNITAVYDTMRVTAMAEQFPTFILTARSGWAAVERMRRFLNRERIEPIEVFCVGRCQKDSQIKKIAEEHRGSQVFFFDDNQNHIDVAHDIRRNVYPIRSVQDRDEWATDEYLSAMFVRVVESALS